MHPTLIDLGKFSIHSYGFMLALSFLAGIYLASYRAKKYGLEVQHILDLSVYIILAAVIGSRLLYVAFHLEEYESIVDVIALWQGGATLYGGLILCVVISYAYASKHKINFLFLADIMAPSISLGIVFTRMGCFLSGCCFGKPTSLPWGLQFPQNSAAGMYAQSMTEHLHEHAVVLHPTQLYSSLNGLVIFVLLMLLDKKLVKRGATFGAFLIMYGLARFTVDFFRFYEENMHVLGNLGLNQVLSLGLCVLGLWLMLRKSDQKT